MPTWPDIRAFAQHAEGLGVDSLWLCDHFVSHPPALPAEGVHEAWTILAALAASTTRAELGPLVVAASFRSPALLAKMAMTADEVSGGRLILGLGAGWDDAEHVKFGYPTDHRVERFAEALDIVRPLLRAEQVSFVGRFHQAREAVLLPPPVRRVPILIAATGPRMLQLTARHADAWNTAWFTLPDARLRAQLAALRTALAAEARDPSTLRRTVGVRFSRRDDAASAWTHVLDEYEALGFDDVIVGLDPPSRRSIDALAAAIEQRTA